ncbi:g10395 [Coccomyxa viridis]|uniref:Succinate dehydrogenase [ubiquinone] cytochrome b small subunit n=1 Tax=Coccomyxa viridis TaxID=1274662 RepID=A0ABP1G7X4_9CHLO
MDKILRADAAGPAFQRLAEANHAFLAGAVPLAALSPKDTTFGKAVDLALGVAIPVHSHIAINSVLSDYVPKSVLGVTRWGALATTGIALAGLLKLNLQGPGITETVKQLWRK